MIWNCKTILLIGLFSAPLTHAQVISTLGSGTVEESSYSAQGIVSTMSEGTIREMDYANDDLILNWTKIMGVEDIDESRSAEAQHDLDKAINEAGKLDISTIKGNLTELQKNLPVLLSPDGIDMFLLTNEGICIYSAIDEPVYMIDLSEEAVKWIRFYAYDKRKYTEAIFKRYAKWEPLLRQYFYAAGIPTELSELCLVESGCTYKAVSSAGAVGMWQIMPATGRDYGMAINAFEDDRTDPVRSSIVAAKILKNNYKLTGDWTLAAAAYNCGAGRITPYIKNGGTTNWESVYSKLPLETQRYIPRLFALHYVWTYRKKLGFKI